MLEGKKNEQQIVESLAAISYIPVRLVAGIVK